MTDRNQEDLRYMQMALDMAKLGRGYTNPNPMVGAVIVKDGQVIAKGYHHCCGQGHAEVEAFRIMVRRRLVQIRLLRRRSAG